MAEPYRDPQETPAARLGQTVYHDALSDRYGFRDDQIGIPADDEIWSEIFEEIGQTVFAAGYVPASEVQRAREEALAEIAKWQKPSHVRLHAGEMTAQEMRSVQAVLGAIARALATPTAAPGGQDGE